MKLYKILHVIFLIAIMISCSQETVINKSITEKLNAPDTKMCIDIVTEKSRTVRPGIAKWQIDIELLTPSDAVKSEDNSETLRFSRIIGGRITSTTFINVTTGNYKISVSGKTENDVTILSGKNDNFPVDTYEINTCTIEMKDTFDNNSKSTDGSGHLNVTISGLNGLFTDGEDFILTYRKLSESDNGTRITLNYENGTLTGESEEPIPAGSYKIDITHDDETKTKVNLVKDPVVNIYPDATTDINWEWSYDKTQINADQDLKDLKIPVWDKNADGNNNVGYIGADALFAYPDMTDETFVACDTDDADNMWVLTITDTTEETTDEATTVTNTYKLKNLNTEEIHTFKTLNYNIIDFCICSIDVRTFIENTEDFTICDFDKEEVISRAILELGETAKYLVLLADNSSIFSHLIKNEIPNDFVLQPGIDNEVFYNFHSHCLDPYPGSDSSPLTAIEACGTNLYIAGIKSSNAGGHQKKLGYIFKTNIINIGGLNTCASDLDSLLENLNRLSMQYSINEVEDNKPHPTLTLNMGKYIETTTTDFYNDAFKISDMYVKDDTLYITAGCVTYLSEYDTFEPEDSDDSFCYSFGGLFKFEDISQFDDASSEYIKNYNFEDLEVTFPEINFCTGLNKNPSNKNFIKHGNDNEYYVLQGLMQAETDDSPYFAGPRCIIPSGNRLFIIDSGFYGEYSQITDKSTGEETTIFTLQDKRNRIFTYDIKDDKLSLTKVDDSISFDYDYITETEQTDIDEFGNIIPVSW